MDYESIAMLRQIESFTTERVALYARLLGMEAENQQRALKGYCQAYDEKSFVEIAEKLETLSANIWNTR